MAKIHRKEMVVKAPPMTGPMQYPIVKRITKVAISARCAELPSGMKKHMPAMRSIAIMNGKVARSRLRRPNESMRRTDGIAKIKLTAPKAKLINRAAVTEAPASAKMLDE